MNNMICLEAIYSTTRQVTKDKPIIENYAEEQFESVLFLPESEGRRGEGGLRIQGYFKASISEQPLITVVTIVFNGVQFLEETIQSVINQTYDNVEYIIIDGGSNDGTLAVIKKYEHAIDYWVSEKDEGIADAFNKGLASASGDYILYLNADDKLANIFVVAEMVSMINEHDFPTLIYGDIEYIDRVTDHVIHRISMPFSPQALLNGKMIPHPSLFTHRSYFAKYGNFDINFRIAVDYEWLLRGVLKESIVHIPMLVTSFRDGGVSTVNEYKVKSEVVTALKSNGFLLSNIAEIRMRIYFYLRITVKRLLSRLGLHNSCLNFKKYLSEQVIEKK